MTADLAEDGRTVVLVHGLMCDERVWAHQRAALTAFRVAAPSIRGLDSLTSMAQVVLDSVEGRFHLVGHSMGGRVALEVMRTDAQRVESLVLLDTGVHPVGADEPTNRQVLLDVAEADGMEGVARDWIPPMLHPDRHDDSPLMSSMTEMVMSYTVADYQGQVRALLGRTDAGPLLEQIRCPSLVACGRQDAWSTLPQHEAIAARIPGAELAVIEDSGHMVTVERPEAVSDLLVDFLVRTASGR